MKNTEFKWFQSYLQDRKQYAECDAVKSRTKNIEFGVIQGSSLGPSLFSCFISSFSKLNLNGKPIIYADDIAIVYSESDCQELNVKMNYDIHNWICLHKLTVNVKKNKTYANQTKQYSNSSIL